MTNSVSIKTVKPHIKNIITVRVTISVGGGGSNWAKSKIIKTGFCLFIDTNARTHTYDCCRKHSVCFQQVCRKPQTRWKRLRLIYTLAVPLEPLFPPCFPPLCCERHGYILHMLYFRLLARCSVLQGEACQFISIPVGFPHISSTCGASIVEQKTSGRW